MKHIIHSAGTGLDLWCCRCACLFANYAETRGRCDGERIRADHVITCGPSKENR